MQPRTTHSEPGEFSICQAVEYRSATAPNAPLLTFIDGADEVTVTNAEFSRRVDDFAVFLTRSGFGPGDACVVHTGNTISFVVVLVAVIRLGGVVVPSIAQSTADELGYVIGHSEARLLITTGELEPVARRAAAGSDCRVHVDVTLPALANASPEPMSTSAIELGTATAQCPDGTGILMYTSGSSGRPKGVLLSRNAIDFTIGSYAEHLRLRDEDTVLICLPLFHVNGMMLQLLPSILSGAHVVLVPKFSASAYWHWVRDHNVTVGHLVNGPIRLLLQAPESEMQTTMRAISFGLPLDSDEIAAFEHRFGLQLLMVWGLTETCCGATLMGLGHRRRGEHQNVGPVLRGWDVRAVDDRGHPVAAGVHGELFVGSPGIMSGYHRDTDATRATLRDGYVATGDLGYLDDDGYVHFVSRIKDMLKPSGENVAAAEIQDALQGHPDVQEAAVFGVDDPIRVERVVAAVVPEPDSTPSEDELRAHCADRLAPFKVPSEILFVSEIPKTSIGKQQVGELKRRYLAAQDTR